MSKKLIILLGSSLMLAGLTACNTAETFNLGYVQDEDTISLVDVGSSREQVLLALGTPSTVTNDNGEAFYYISQTKKRDFAFQKTRVTDQRVLAIYFDNSATVSRKANFGLKDGKVFDFISRTTPTGGRDLSFLGQVLGAFGGTGR